MKQKLNVWSKTYKGRKPENEDSIFIDKDNGIFIITDGMSGHNGKYASNAATQFIGQSLKDELLYPSPDSEGYKFVSYLTAIIERANERLLTHAKAKELDTIAGTTLDVVVFKDEKFYYAHIGDGRIYVISKNNQLIKLTKDQTTVKQLVSEGKLTKEQAKVAENYYQLMYFLGDNDFNKETIETGSISEPKKLVLMTDGLSDVASRKELESLILDYKGEKLIERAFELYKNPYDVCELYLRYNSEFVIDLLQKQTEDTFSDLQYGISKISGKNNVFNFILNYLDENKKKEYLFLKKIKAELSERDNFSIISIEPKKKFKVFGGLK